MKAATMKVRKAREQQNKAEAPPPRWPYYAAGLAALILVFWAYGPALNGPFLFDDTALPFALPAFKAPLINWLKADVRPVLFFTYYLNAQASGEDPNSYHVVNVLIHLFSTGLVFLIVRRLLQWRGPLPDGRNSSPESYHLLAGLAAAIFLLHPAQSEAVAYLAGRSESLSAMFGLAAFAVFVYRKQTAVTWSVALAVLALFGLALASKQNAIALPALLLLTDFWWNPGFSRSPWSPAPGPLPRVPNPQPVPIRPPAPGLFSGILANWKLYVPIGAGALAGVAFFWRVITTAETAGFGMKDLKWYQYFFTECRALFVYLRIFLWPANLNADWDFSISRTILDHGAIVGLIVLLALVAAAWHYRRQFPLATFGLFVFLVMMAPTSSILPIRDPIAERRLYPAIIGLLLIGVDLVSRLKVARKVLVGASLVLILLAAGVTHARAAVWSDPLALWEDTAQKAPNKRRVRFQLGMAYFLHKPPDYDRAVAEFEKTAALEPPDYNLLIDWGLALQSLGRTDEAVAKLRQAAAKEPTAHVYSQIAVVYASNQRYPEALDALNTSQRIDPNFPPIYLYRGNAYFNQARYEDAKAEYEHGLQFTLAQWGNEQDLRQECQQNLMTTMQKLQSGLH